MSSIRPTLESTTNLPWEVLRHIYAHCNTATLVALSLVCFGSWELAGPLLYEHVELGSLDAIKSLLFLDATSPSARLNPPVPLLRRIKTLTLSTMTWDQATEPKIKRPGRLPQGPSDFSTVLDSLLVPHRLLRSGFPSILPLEQLVLLRPRWWSEVFGLLSYQLLPFLNPKTVTHRDPDAGTPLGHHMSGGSWISQSSACGLTFLSSWTHLERVIWRASLFSSMVLESGWPATTPLYSTWTPPPGSGSEESRRPLELVYDFAIRKGSYQDTFPPPAFILFGLSLPGRTLGDLLHDGGANEGLAGRVALKLKVTLVVKAAERGGRQDRCQKA